MDQVEEGQHISDKWRLIPVEPGDKQLKIFGYAPGTYMNKCLACGQSKGDLDKRASSCRECADRRYRRIILECSEPAATNVTPLTAGQIAGQRESE